MKLSFGNQLKLALVFILTLFCLGLSTAQEKAASPHDFGKMWTFENPPKDWFTEEYGFSPEDEWWTDVRKSALRFASWCSASFVSADGLIMTNHHCSRDVAVELQKDGETFDDNGFYASTLEDERKSEGLFVEQLVQTVDITASVLASAENAENEAQASELKAKAIEEIQAKYSAMEGWEGLRTQVVTYYSGGKYSLYGYKKYSDIRLVFIPETQLGFFGGDPDNFTFPRYSLDCTFWRAYDEDGNPMNTSEHFFKFNTDGVQKDEPVFVVGNPGTTERYRTVAQLEFDKNIRYPQTLKYMRNRLAIMQAEYDANPTEQLLGDIFGLANGYKAYTGIQKGLEDEHLFGRKVEMEQKIKAGASNVSYWNDLAAAYEKLTPNGWAINHLAPSSRRGKILGLLHQLAGYEKQIAEEATKEELETTRGQITAMSDAFNDPKEKQLFELLLTEVNEDIYEGDMTMKNLLKGKSVSEYVNTLFDKTNFKNAKKANKCLKKTKKVKKDDDPLLVASRTLIPAWNKALEAFQSSSAYRKDLEAKIANQAFQVYGTTLPPDATFTLRISDGMVKDYDYNGTTAPILTTYFGMYDRHYSYEGEKAWSLPEKWMNPPMELLKSPMNFVSTNDIIGGNSGSAIINKNKEAVGLIFDGNIESLPGRFIFDDESNRSVSVHAGGIVAALKYIYKANRLVAELSGE